MRRELAALMAQIDALDEELVALLGRRFRHSRRIGDIKRDLAMPKSDPARIADQVRRFRLQAASADLDIALAETVIGAILDRVVAEREQAGRAGR